MTRDDDKREALIYPVVVAVMIVWMAMAAYGVVTSLWTPLEVTTPVMLLVVGYVLGIKVTKEVK